MLICFVLLIIVYILKIVKRPNILFQDETVSYRQARNWQGLNEQPDIHVNKKTLQKDTDVHASLLLYISCLTFSCYSQPCSLAYVGCLSYEVYKFPV